MVKDSLVMCCCMLHRAVGATAAADISGVSAAPRESWDCSEVGTPCHFWSSEGCLDVHPREYDLVYKPPSNSFQPEIGMGIFHLEMGITLH